GAVDQRMITMGEPLEVMHHVKTVLVGMGVEMYVESEFKYRCIHAKQCKSSFSGGGMLHTLFMCPPSLQVDTTHGTAPEDAGDEVRFSIELTRLDHLNDTYSLNIRRLKGDLWSYKFLYDTLRQ
ncbi:hypothetical protein C8R44DRAFT_528495, partial [Mycena epipterygia]